MKYVLAATVALTACGGEGGDAGRPPPAPTTALTVDAGVADAGITKLPSFDPSAGFAIDPDPQPRSGRGGSREHRDVELLLRSTPVGAIAAVDGRPLGPTPVPWVGEASVSHEFTFVLPGHALARYRFVPMTNGIVHGRLVKIASDAPVVAPTAPTEAPRPAVRPPPPPPIDAAPTPIDAAPPPDVDAAPPLPDEAGP